MYYMQSRTVQDLTACSHMRARAHMHAPQAGGTHQSRSLPSKTFCLA
jgi:hypothetical protein